MAPKTASKSAKGKAPVKSTKVGEKYIIDCSKPVNDRIFDTAAFEKFLHDRIKIEGRTGQLADKVKISREGDHSIIVQTTIPFSKRYLKFLTKKFLKRNQMREWLRVIATAPNRYTLVFFNMDQEEEEDDE